MSDINVIEERLFLALETIEKLAEKAEQSQANTERLLAIVEEQQRTIVTLADNKMTEVDTTYKHVNDVMFQGVYQAISKNVSPMIEREVEKAIKNNIVKATSVSVGQLVEAIDNAAEKTTEITTTESSLNSKIALNASKKLDEMTDKMTTFEKSLALKHYGVLALFGVCMFALMCLALFIFMKFGMPSAEENQRIRLENDALLKQRVSLMQGNQQIRR